MSAGVQPTNSSRFTEATAQVNTIGGPPANPTPTSANVTRHRTENNSSSYTLAASRRGALLIGEKRLSEKNIDNCFRSRAIRAS